MLLGVLRVLGARVSDVGIVGRAYSAGQRILGGVNGRAFWDRTTYR
jgi:hypothetical protein